MSLLKIIRFYNLIIIALTQLVVRIFIIGPKSDWKNIVCEFDTLLIMASTVLIAAAGYIINDYYDVKIDAINKPERVVIDRSMKRRQAIIVHFILNFIGIGLGLFIHWKLSIIYTCIATLLWLYSNVLKRKPLIGNLTIAFLSAATILILAVYYKTNVYIIITFSVFAFIVSLMREIIKDMQDIKGDMKFGCKTLPIVWGMRRTKSLLYLVSVIFITTVVIMLYKHHLDLLWYNCILTFPLILIFIVLLIRADTTRKFRFLSHFCKLILLTGVISLTIY